LPAGYDERGVPSRHRLVLVGLLVVVGVLATAILSQVLATVFFAITVAYVLYPLREQLVARGAPARLASGLASLFGLLGVLLTVLPLAYALYRRRNELLALLGQLPDVVVVELGEFTYPIEVATLVDLLRSWLSGLAVDLARAAPVLGLKLVVFAFVVYGLLLQPRAPRQLLFALVPDAYRDILLALHRRIRETLYAIYVLQAATALATFLTALVVFGLLGYRSAFTFAVVAALLQFIPVVGPSVLVLALAAYDLAFGDPTRAVSVLILGLLVVAFLPDAVVRPRLAEWTTHLPASVYFVGFTGGVLSLGFVGFIAGPLVVAILMAVVELLAETGGIEADRPEVSDGEADRNG
jgi:predicted PurR-regulated permease PerM